MAIDFQWDKKFAIGQVRIDYEHQMFLELMRNVSLAAEQGETKEWCVRLLREVRKYAEFHFYSEENAMLKMGYPEYLSHQQQHSEFLSGLDERIEAYITDKIDIEAVVVFLLDGFALHSTHSDKKLAKFLTKNPA